MKSITLPDSIKSLGKQCFFECVSLTSINLSDSIRLGEDCFKNCDSLNTPETSNRSEKKKVDIEKITELAAKGDASATQQLDEYEWHVGDYAYARMFGEWEKLTITRFENGEDKLNEQEVEQLLWLCSEFDGKDEQLVEDALMYCNFDEDDE